METKALFKGNNILEEFKSSFKDYHNNNIYIINHIILIRDLTLKSDEKKCNV